MDHRALLAQSRLFAGIDSVALDQLAERTTVCDFRSGQAVFAIGAPADCVYIVATGRLRVENADGSLRGEVGLLECVGEVAILSGHARSAEVYAVRDSYLLRIGRDDLLEFLQAHPDVLLRLTRVVIARLQMAATPSSIAASSRPRCIALVPASPHVDLNAIAQRMHGTLTECGEVRIVDGRSVDAALGKGISQMTPGMAAEDILVRHLHAAEGAHRHLIYLCDRVPSSWTDRCLRQCDRVMVVADARTPPTLTPMLEELRDLRLRVPVELILLCPDDCSADSVLPWRELSGARTHYLLRPEHPRDSEALARSISGRALGLVLGGGGARGFAHIGLLRALEELKLPLDVLGGTSMGAFVSALAACGYDWKQVLQITRETFVERHLLNDYLLPRVALIRGRKFYRRLQTIFGERRIEELRTPYFCVSTNLTRGKPVVHDRGPLALWVATSMAIPGVAPPVVWQGDLLVDGGVVNSLPTDVMQSLERGPIIASDVSTEGALTLPGVEGPDVDAILRWAPLQPGEGRRPSLISILFRTATLTSESGVAARAARADAYLRLPVSGVALFDWKKLDEVAQRGYEFAMQQLPALEARLRACPI
ncbi:MAG: cyclic nucleotide-binding protein [Hydrocarboniphaga sp.]|uniref:patatin-like phospholipase family protein n=1 Tax=Hydrocarboniphaga sp. TaxID=2033016 RepID=UPI00262D7344|nr:patatin-like phospholipase family protein [Hydrocarboniphaga sp.]MDB5972928.1 cyclic nucleotide-binding protein [Hydrocarboniphaga sp.]